MKKVCIWKSHSRDNREVDMSRCRAQSMTNERFTSFHQCFNKWSMDHVQDGETYLLCKGHHPTGGRQLETVWWVVSEHRRGPELRCCEVVMTPKTMKAVNGELPGWARQLPRDTDKVHLTEGEALAAFVERAHERVRRAISSRNAAEDAFQAARDFRDTHHQKATDEV